MRRYPVNSPQAAGRIVALTAVADVDIGSAEIVWRDRRAEHAQLGLAHHELHALLDNFRPRPFSPNGRVEVALVKFSGFS